MAQGLSRRSGQPPDPNALRREHDKDQWTTLPQERTGPLPKWPLPNPSARELELWAEEWVRPQATMWERNGQEREVAFFCRAFAEAEQPEGKAATRVLVKQLMENLGLTIPGLQRNRWTIPEQEGSAPTPREKSAVNRKRFRVVE